MTENEDIDTLRRLAGILSEASVDYSDAPRYPEFLSLTEKLSHTGQR